MEGPKLKGKIVYLRPLVMEDINGDYPKWFDDIEVCRYNQHTPFTKTKKDFIDYVEKVSKSKNDYVFAICDIKDNKHIGNIALQKIDLDNKNGELAIIIGEKNYWGKGVGKEAWKLLMNYGFDILKLHRIYCGTHNENVGMQRIATACGMRKEGRLKDAMFKNGKYVDVVIYGKRNKDN